MKRVFASPALLALLCVGLWAGQPEAAFAHVRGRSGCLPGALIVFSRLNSRWRARIISVDPAGDERSAKP